MYVGTQIKHRCREALLSSALVVMLASMLPLVVLLVFILRPLVTLLAIAIVLAAVLMSMLEPRLEKRLRDALDDSGLINYRGIRIAKDVAYDRGHCWVRDDAEVVVGVNDLVPALLGSIERVRVPALGRQIRRGEALFTLHSGDRSIDLPAPVSGEVIGVNPMLQDQPELIASRPFTAGWVAMIHPDRLADEKSELLSGLRAVRWMRRRIDSVRRVVNQGNTNGAGLPSHIDAAVWPRVRELIFTGRR